MDGAAPRGEAEDGRCVRVMEEEEAAPDKVAGPVVEVDLDAAAVMVEEQTRVAVVVEVGDGAANVLCEPKGRMEKPTRERDVAEGKFLDGTVVTADMDGREATRRGVFFKRLWPCATT